MYRRRVPIGNKVLIVLSILLGVLLVGFLFWNRKTEQAAALQLKQIEMERDSENVNSDEGDVSLDQEAEPEDGDDAAGIQENEDKAQEGDARNEQEAENSADGIQGISFRGDSFGSAEDKARNGVGICLVKILEENGQGIAVEDYSMDAAGTLSQMKLAGVDQSELEAYLEKHAAEANGAELRITETKIRDLSEEDLVRTDQSYIPVICMGYYGGWGNDLDELCEQQQKILDTYQRNDRYLILGVYPTGYSDRDAYREKMVSQWGEHYVSVSDEISNTVSSSDGKKEMAQLIYDKLTELGYLS